jgi:outer membrane protein assembly factor BamE (lipoprotein component of BamABCDE complex)
MDYRALTVSATLAFTGLAGVATICRADIVASQDGITVRDAGVAAPARGMTMSQVANKFGAPVTKIPAVGNPPISRWDYPGFVVYFERDHVIHSVVSEAASDDAAPAAAAPAPAAPVDQAPPPSPSAESKAPPST